VAEGGGDSMVLLIANGADESYARDLAGSENALLDVIDIVGIGRTVEVRNVCARIETVGGR
jgi:hypothetical protein